MLSVRGALLFGWLVLIASLLWDPFSEYLTNPDNLQSPFRIKEKTVVFQDRYIDSTPYSMGARIFWTMLVPIVPLFLMVFGHEAWRRVCPLSLASQLSGYAGVRRLRSKLDRRTGLIKKTLPLVDRNGWLARNSWYVQFGFLFTGICARLLIINSDRYALAAALLFVICAAMLTGFLWGGKTWCNFFCPANVVQKIYTEPGGLLESKPHLSKPSIPQSMCRKPVGKSEVSACVACTANCGDIDLQRSYWNGVIAAPRKNVYYMFFGLIIGFYGYYYLYSGSWDYYFSGVWTHEAGLLSTILSPGLYIFGEKIPVPKMLAVPLVLSAACATSWGIGRILEFAYLRARRKSGLPNEVLIHHCLTVSAWLSINAFYIFGGRPNILLLPNTSITLVDLMIWGLTTTWLWVNLHKSPARYQKEGMVVSLLKELRRHTDDVGDIFDMKKLNRINKTEVNLLARILPKFTRQQKVAAYQKVLNEEITKGTTSTATFFQLLEDLRHELNISEKEHTDLVEELGLTLGTGIESSNLSAEEKAISLAQYKSFLVPIISAKLALGGSVAEALQDESILASVNILRRSLQISDIDHAAAIAEVSAYSQEGYTVEQGLDKLMRFAAVRHCLESADIADRVGNSLLAVFLRGLDELDNAFRVFTLERLTEIQARSDAAEKAADLVSLTGVGIRGQFTSAKDTTRKNVLSPEIAGILEGTIEFDDSRSRTVPTQRYTRRRAMLESLNLDTTLETIVGLEDQVIQAIGLALFNYVDADMVRATALDILSQNDVVLHPVLLATVESLAQGQGYDPAELSSISVTVAVKDGSAPAFKIKIDKKYFTIGTEPDNDIHLANVGIARYHAALRVEEGGVVLVRLDEVPLFVGPKVVEDESVALDKMSIVSFGSSSKSSSKIQVDWECGLQTVAIINAHPIVRLGLLASNSKFSELPVAALAELALQTEAKSYVRNEKPFSANAAFDALVIYDGIIRASNSTGDMIQGGKVSFSRDDCLTSKDCAVLPLTTDSRTAVVLSISYNQDHDEVN